MRDFLRHVNLVFGVLGLWLVGVVGWYVICRFRAGELIFLRSQLAVAILIFFVFETLRIWRVWVYLLPGASTDTDFILVTGATGGTVGMVCMCRILTPVAWGTWRWTIPVMMVIAAAGVSQAWLS